MPRAPRWFAFASAFAFAFAFAAAFAAGPAGGRLYRNDALRIHMFEPPPAWQPAPQASYPRLLCGYTHPDGGRLTLAAQKVAPGTSAESLARAAKLGLERQGFSSVQIALERDPAHEDAPPRARLDAKLDTSRRFLKQLYVVDGALGYVVSLVASNVNAPAMTRDFDWAAHSLSISSETPRLDPDGGVPR
jgi:hypothetical protein